MAENQESTPNIIEQLALVTDAMQNMFKDGKVICVYELNNEDFKKVQRNFREVDQQYKKFSIDISGLEHVFIHEDYNYIDKNTEENKIEPELKKGFISNIRLKLSSWFKSGRSPVK